MQQKFQLYKTLYENALNTPVSVSETAGEGGAWGMALLAAYMMNKGERPLGDWLEEVFKTVSTQTVLPKKVGGCGL